ncbi:MAG TPA: CAP domain-containing protein, partial [Pyrinomonadaceae bacterium]|nr:CAP domain-containing protein [Pyrinomonadaceae bacterium]
KAAGSSLGLCLCSPHVSYLRRTQDAAPELAAIRANLLQLVNEEREAAKQPALALDEFAAKVAAAHALDMATGEFVSHWGRDGLKPYQRYSFAGGVHATQENVSAADNTWSMRTKDLLQDTSYLHIRLYNEQPPNDGHRRAILAPQHTHVGFGVAIEKLHLRIVELFVSQYVELKQIPQKAKPGDSIDFTGRLLRASHVLNQIEVCYEPLPKAPELSWLQTPRSYSLPDESIVLVPKLPPPFSYADRRSGSIDLDPSGRFSVPIQLSKGPGIYTVVCWVKRTRSEKAFPATEFCIRAE